MVGDFPVHIFVLLSSKSKLFIMKTYLIGRSQTADITITDANLAVSRIHLELTIDAQHRYYIVDRSASGTFSQQHGRWIRIQQGYVTLDERLLLGNYQTSLRQLLALRNYQSILSQPQPDGYDGPVERNPETGEIIPKRKP
jgi:predicted component of type VI protein secretion system